MAVREDKSKVTLLPPRQEIHISSVLSTAECEDIKRKAMKQGFTEAYLLRASDVVTARWVGLKCRYGCANYNTNWCCPPASPTLQTFKELLGEYEVALLLVGERNNEHFYRNSPLKRRQQIKEWKQTISLERKLFLMGYYKAFGLPAETCALCKQCAYPEQCRFPNDKRPSIEACGIDVFATIKRLGFSAHLARNLKETYKNYSMILVL